MYSFFLLITIFSFFAYGNNFTSIILTKDNFITIRGTIDETISSNFIYDLNRKKNKTDVYVYLNTNGGSVESGNKILLEIQK